MVTLIHSDETNLIADFSLAEASGLFIGDKSPGNNHGTILSGSREADPVRGSCFLCNGTSDYASAAAAIITNETQAFTWLIWARWDGSGGGGDGRKFMLESYGAVDGSFVLAGNISTAANGNVFQTFTRSTTSNYPITTAFTPTVGEWYLYAVTVDRAVSTNNYTAWVNGQVVGQTTYNPEQPFAEIQGIRIGTYRSANNRWFHGALQGLLVYDRALTQAEILSIYAGGRTSTHVRGAPAEEDLLRVTFLDFPRVIEPSTTTYTEQKDRNVTVVSGGTVKNDLVALVESTPGAVTLSSSNTDIAAPNGNSFAHSADGVANVYAASAGQKVGRRIHFITTPQVAPQNIFTGFGEGSLGRHVSDVIDLRIADKTANNTTKKIFSTENHTTATYVRNVECWAYGLDLTCLSPWNSRGINKRAGTLVTPDIIVFAAHYLLYPGDTLRFITVDNQVITRTIVGKTVVQADLACARLDSDLPSSIKPAKLLDPVIRDEKVSRWGLHLRWFGVPCIALDQEEKALVKNILNHVMTLSVTQASATIWPKRKEFDESLISGDSGNPALVFVNNEPCVLATWQTSGGGTSVTIDHEGNNLANSITVLGSPHDLQYADLSGFPDADDFPLNP